MPPFSPRFIVTRDGTRLRTAVFAAASSRGVCVLLGGQTEFIEKYVEVIGELGARGFTVATFDWRGQGGSARLLANPLKAHVRDFAEYDDDLTSFLGRAHPSALPAR
jgi:lysophospholipase